MELVEPPCQAVHHPLGEAAAPQLSNPQSAPEGGPKGSVRSSRGALGLPCLALVLVAWNTFLVYALLIGLPHNDFCRMYYTARAFWQGEDMYGWNPATPVRLNDSVAIDLWNMNPPHFHLVLLPIAVLPHWAALACWWVVNLICLGVSLRWIVRELGLELTPRVRQLGLVALLGFTGTSTMILTSQLALLLLAPMTLAWIWARQGRWGLSGCALGLLIAVKPFLLLLVPYLLLRRRWTALAACGAAVLACFGLGVLVFGVANHLSWYGRLELAGDWAWLPMNASLLGAIRRTFADNPLFTEAATWSAMNIQLAFVGLGGAIGLASLAGAARDSKPGEVDRNFALLIVASILLCPLGWAYYFWLPLGPVIAVMHEWRRGSVPVERRQRWGRAVFWIAVAGLFWPVQFNTLGQQSALATVVFANLYFWTAFGIWLGLMMRGRPAAIPLAAAELA